MKWIESKIENYKILKSDEKYISSFYNPMAEATRWVQSLNNHILKKQNLIVLGCGSGYHIDQLDRVGIYKSVFVLCVSQAQKELVENKFKFSDTIKLFGPKDLNQDILDQIGVKNFGICEIKTDLPISPSLYKEYKNKITQREDQYHTKSFDFKVNASPKKNELMSVKHISFIKNTTIDKIIQELIK